MDALYRLRSITISGLAGMGKSNVVRFIVSHPQVRPQYLKERAGDYALLHVDCAGLADDSEAEILSEIAAQLRYEQLSVGAAQAPGIRRALKEQILGLDPDLNLVLILDYFDEVAQRLERPFYNYLFHLRNSRPRANLMYVFAARRPLGYLHELQELLDDGCIVGPLDHRDALDSIRRDEARLGCVFDALQRERLVACTGGHPGLLKNASELLGSGQVDARLPAGELARQLLGSAKVSSLCQELWQDLTPDEQNVLFNVARGVPLPQARADASVAYLEQSGILDKSGGMFGPLFEAFVRDKLGDYNRVHIEAVFPNQAHLKSPTGEELVALSPKLFALLLALAEARGQVLSSDELVSRVYGDEALGVSDAALSQLVKRLRSALNPAARRLLDDPTFTCVETVRDVGYRLNS
jgi:DNA-binding winged helix-turn-helix (wHTH) protein